MKNGLKPCPFCGGTDLVISACEEFVAIVCDFRQSGCGASGGYRYTEEEAVEKRHGNNEYGVQYRKEIEKVKALFELGGE